jgi:phenylalanyl-tRNA synthetase beta subunit
MFKWSLQSAIRKATSDITVSVTVPPVTISKTTTTHNPNTDAYRNCSRCGKHINYHVNGKCT